MTYAQIIAELDLIFAMLGRHKDEYPARKAIVELKQALAAQTEETPTNG